MSQLQFKWRRLAAATAAAVAVLAVSACSSAVDQKSSSGPAGTPKNGGTLVVAQVADADPGSFLKTSFGNILTEYAVFETLTKIDQKTGKPGGVLAKTFELAPDGKSMKLTLRDDVTFHSGAKLTPQDVIFTIKKVQDPKTGAANQAIAAEITGMKAVGDDGVELTFSRSLPNIYDLFETMPILNPATYSDYAAGKVVDGTGPFEWSSWTPGGKIVLTKYADYREADEIHLDKIEIDIIGDATAMVSAIRSGRLQYGVGMAALDAYSLSKQPGYQLISTGGSAIPLAFDTTKAPFNDKRVRQAIQYAIDRDRIVKQVESNQGEAVSLPWRTTTVGYDAMQASHYTYDPAKAKELLKEAGVSDLTFDMVAISDNPESMGVFQIVKNNLEAVGLHAKAESIATTEYDSRIASGQMGAPVWLMSASNGLSPASAVLGRPELLAKGNPEHFETPEYTKLVQQLTTATGEKAQAAALHAYNDYFLDQAFAVPLVTKPTMTVATDAVQGIRATQMGFLDLTHVWLDE